MDRKSSSVQVCRKDMQCTCTMCIASFQATWDLRRPFPANTTFHPITNLEEAFNESIGTPTPARLLKRVGKENETPKSKSNDEKICRPLAPFMPGASPLSLQPVARFSPPAKTGDEWTKRIKFSHKSSRFWMTTSVLLVVAIALTLAWKWMPASVVIYPALTGFQVESIAVQSLARNKIVHKLDFIQRKILQSVPGEQVSNCTGPASRWTLNDVGHLTHSDCLIYHSSAESVKVWGFPVRTVGILGRSIVDRSFTVLSGRVFEWREGQSEYKVYSKGETWVFPQLAASSIQVEGNTWIIEYKKSSWFGLRSSSGFAHLLHHHLRRLSYSLRAAFDTATFAVSVVTFMPGTETVPT